MTAQYPSEDWTRIKTKPAACQISNINVDTMTFEQALRWVVDHLRLHRDERPLALMGANSQVVMLAEESPELSHAMSTADACFADGVSVVLASRLLGPRIPERIPCGEMMELLAEQAALHGWSVFLLGGLPGAAELAAEELGRRYPHLRVAGCLAPPLGFEQNATIASQIKNTLRDAKPDLLFVALGVPKQELWIAENCPALPIGAALTVGAAFDTLAGLRKRAPKWTRLSGTEWLYRLCKEPRRLWYRYTIGNVKFAFAVIRSLLRSKHPNG